MPQGSINRTPGNNPLPAVMVGGPPHSGKSVLVYSLTQALRERGVPHYVLRACPDGEGDWSNEMEQDDAQMIRVKGQYSPAFIAEAVRYVENRQLPLLVDVGGKPRPWQEVVFDRCTAAILLVAENVDKPAVYERELVHWTAMMERHGVPLLAQLQSALGGENRLLSRTPWVTGVLGDLQRGSVANGPAFEALVERLAGLFLEAAEALEPWHLGQAPVEIVLHLPRLARTVGAQDGVWQPQQLPVLCDDYLPTGTPLALYGRAPNWIYTALALLAAPADVWLFDAREGWVMPPTLPLSNEALPAQPGWQARLRRASMPAAIVVEMGKEGQFLKREEPQLLPLPLAPQGSGIILSGPVPFWLLVAAARQYVAQCRWMAVFYPQAQGAVVVHSKDAEHKLGELIALDSNGG
jgi:CRISPR-associated protein Csx3